MMQFMKKTPTAAAILSGVLMAAASPGANLPALAWICLVPLCLVTREVKPSTALWLGWIAGCVYHAGLVYWITVSMTLYGGLPWYASVSVLALFAAFLGLFTGLPLYGSCWVWRAARWGYAAVLPLLWTATEYIKSWLLTGFPWDNLAHTQFQQLWVIQIADLTGVWGVSFVLVVVNCCLAEIFTSLSHRAPIQWHSTAYAGLLLAATLGYGVVMTSRELPEAGMLPVRVSMIQPNIPQDLKWDPLYLEATLKKFSSLTAQSRSAAPEVIIWPESATPFFYEAEPAYQSVVNDCVSSGTAYLLFGSPSFQQTSDGPRFFNSAYLLSPRGEIVGKYDKIHLVPYGEYVPLKQVFPFVEKMVQAISDFSPGSDIVLLPLPHCRLGTVICYEIIFPNLVRQFVARGAQAIVNITNDAWFGATSAPVQHLAIAVFRAVENRRWIARCANTGISAVITPSGRIQAQTDIFTETVLSDVLYCTTKKTVYTTFGDFFAQLCCAASVLIMLVALRQRRNPLFR